jgi:hypothetical protein
VLRRLVKGRLKFIPQDDGQYRFEGVGTLAPLLGGIVRKLASPTGVAPEWTRPVPGEVSPDSGSRKAA